MNTTTRLAAVAALGAVTLAGAAAAQEFKGAEVSGEILSFSDDDDTISQTTYRASLEAGVFGGFGVAADLSFYDFGESDSVRGVTLHALYDALQFATLGAFYTRETLDDVDADTFGLEAGRSFGAFGVEAYAGFGSDDNDDDHQIFGLDGTVDVGANVSITGAAALLKLDNADISRIAVGGEYRFGNGPVAYAEIGRVDSDAADSGENYIGLGARIAIGPNAGTTFEPRGITEVLSGL